MSGIEVWEHVWIPLADGTRLAARIWLPEQRPVPGILEYIPYRKRDGTRARDEPMHAWFAAHGYAALRVDQRGSGDSDGLLEDEYLKIEQDDALEVIAWIAAQPWCSGAVGMMGKSWGGFNALQVAARRPPALSAIITVCSTDDRYQDDVHYMGGAVLNDNLIWGTIMLALQARPPDPETAGADWREKWLARIAAMPFFPALWLRHQRRDAYWKQGSVCEDWSAIRCPVLAIGGWVDSYKNAIPRLLAGLSVPRLGIIGPWGHLYPHEGAPGPRIGFLQEAKRWWDHWLKGEANGVMQAPMLRAWLEYPVPPAWSRRETPGSWIGERNWPSRRIVPWRLYLSPTGVLAGAASGEAEMTIGPSLAHGAEAGEWMGTGSAGELPGDQRPDDGRALTCQTAPLAAPRDILGAPELFMALSADRPVAQLCARLSDVAPDGSSARVSYGVLNLTHRASHEHPQPLSPGELVAVRLRLNDCGHRFAAGHRIRLSLATSYWPIVWPAPEAATLTLGIGASRLELPERPPDPADAEIEFGPPEQAPAAPVRPPSRRTLRRFRREDRVRGEIAHVVERGQAPPGEGAFRFEEIGTEISENFCRTLVIRPEAPLSARAEMRGRYVMGREGWRIAITTETAMTSERDAFTLTGKLEVAENGRQVGVREWSERIPRDLM